MLIHDARFFETNQCRTGNGKSGKSWNLRISFPRPGKPWKIKVLFGRLVTLDDISKNKVERSVNSILFGGHQSFCL